MMHFLLEPSKTSRRFVNLVLEYAIGQVLQNNIHKFSRVGDRSTEQKDASLMARVTEMEEQR
jgi:hypothetical protein